MGAENAQPAALCIKHREGDIDEAEWFAGLSRTKKLGEQMRIAHIFDGRSEQTVLEPGPRCHRHALKEAIGCADHLPVVVGESDPGIIRVAGLQFLKNVAQLGRSAMPERLQWLQAGYDLDFAVARRQGAIELIGQHLRCAGEVALDHARHLVSAQRADKGGCTRDEQQTKGRCREAELPADAETANLTHQGLHWPTRIESVSSGHRASMFIDSVLVWRSPGSDFLKRCKGTVIRMRPIDRCCIRVGQRRIVNQT